MTEADSLPPGIPPGTPTWDRNWHRTWDSYGRTDGLTEKVLTLGEISYVSNARERSRILRRVDAANRRPGRCAPSQTTLTTHPATNRTDLA